VFSPNSVRLFLREGDGFFIRSFPPRGGFKLFGFLSPHGEGLSKNYARGKYLPLSKERNDDGRVYLRRVPEGMPRVSLHVKILRGLFLWFYEREVSFFFEIVVLPFFLGEYERAFLVQEEISPPLRV